MNGRQTLDFPLRSLRPLDWSSLELKSRTGALLLLSRWISTGAPF